MANKNLPEVWEVRWEDSTTDHGWNKDKNARATTPDTITSVGFLLGNDERCVRITLSTVHAPKEEFSWHARFDCTTTIPKSAIRKMRRLRKARE